MRRVIGFLLVGAFLVPAPVPAGEERGALAGIVDVLEARARAIRGGDRAAFLGTIDPATSRFARRQRLLFDGFQELPLAEYRLELPDTGWPELTTDRERRRHGRGARVLVVEERYALRGYDTQPAVDELYLTFVPRNGGWRIAADDDLDDLTLFSSRKLWELGPIATRESDHFLFISHPDLADAADTVLRAAEAALVRVGERWPLPWSRRVVILAPRTQEELRRMIRATFDLDVFVAFASSGVDRTQDWRLAGHRIILNWPNFSRHPSASTERILVHELLHIATREYAGPFTPIFVEEGVAEWVTGSESASIVAGRVRDGRFRGRLPLDHEFISGSDLDIIGSYQASSAAVRYAAERFGDETISELYERLGSVRREPGTWRYHLDEALRETMGTGLRRFERDWADWVRDTYG